MQFVHCCLNSLVVDDKCLESWRRFAQNERREGVDCVCTNEDIDMILLDAASRVGCKEIAVMGCRDAIGELERLSPKAREIDNTAIGNEVWVDGDGSKRYKSIVFYSISVFPVGQPKAASRRGINPR